MSALEKLPTTLDEMHGNALDRIKSQSESRRNLAFRALKWITYGKKRLKCPELQHPLASKEGIREIDQTDLIPINSLLSFCAGLVVVHPESNSIHLVHYTTQKYLERTLQKREADDEIGRTCLRYLSFHVFSNPFANEEGLKEAVETTYGLSRYAALYWVDHVRDAEEQYLDILQNLFKELERCNSIFQLWNYVSRAWGPFIRPQATLPLHLAAIFGLPIWCAALLTGHQSGRNSDSLLCEGISPMDARDDSGRTPLSWAASNGHLEVVKLLVHDASVEVDSRDSEYGQTPLSWAAESGHLKVVELLAQEAGAEVDSKDSEYGRTPLSWAAANGHLEVVRLLALELGSDVESNDSDWGRTPLSWAAERGRLEVVKLLVLEAGAEVDSKDPEYEQTPLSWAAESGHLEVVKFLSLEAGAEMGSNGSQNGRTPLSWAAANGHLEVVKFLSLEAGAEMDSKDSQYGRTPLSWAAANGHLDVVKFLAPEAGADFTSDDYYVNALRAASIEGHKAVMRFLLAKGTRFVWTDEERSKVCHERSFCDGCQAHPVQGIRYKCKSCYDYDLCKRCFGNRDKLHGEHNMFLELPVQDPHTMLSKLEENNDVVMLLENALKEEE